MDVFVLFKKLKINIIYTLLIAFVLLLSEQTFRYLHPLLTVNIRMQNIGEYLLIAFILSLLPSKKVIKSIVVFFLLLSLFEYIHFQYYGTWIFPLEFLLGFTEFDEVMETFITVLNITILPIIIILMSGAFIFYAINKMSDERLKTKYLYYLLIVFLVFIPGRVFVKDHSRKGARPNVEAPPIINSFESLGYLFGKILPKKLSGHSGFEKKIIPMPNIKVKHPDVNVVVIMGESLTVSPMSLYGCKDKTTPYLDKLKEDKNFLYQIAFPSGVKTDVSLPSFFNMLYEPDSTPQIISTNTCLFKMAKLNGFETYFYSAQSKDSMSNIKSYLCTKWMDHYTDGTEDTHEFKGSALDMFLVKKMDTIDFSKPNFIVLHQRGSHSPVSSRYPKEFEVFKSSKSKFINEYKDSVLYTDYVLHNIIKKLKEKSDKPTYVFFTSDHGTGVDGEHFGHGRLGSSDVTRVPFFMYKINSPKDLKYDLKDGKYTSHFEISKLVAQALGYDISNFRVCNGKYITCGKDITGISGYLETNVKDQKIEKQKIIIK